MIKLLLILLFILTSCDKKVYRKLIVNDPPGRIVIQINEWEYYKSGHKDNIQIDENFFEETNVDKGWVFYNFGFDADIFENPYLAPIATIIGSSTIIIYDMTDLQNICTNEDIHWLTKNALQNWKKRGNVFDSEVYLKTNAKKCMLFRIESHIIEIPNKNKILLDELEKIITSFIKFM